MDWFLRRSMPNFDIATKEIRATARKLTGTWSLETAGEFMFNGSSTKTFNVEKTRLLDALRANRAKHSQLFEVSMRGYRLKVVEVLQTLLTKAEKEEDINHRIDLDRPENHTVDYNRAIEIVEWTVGDEISISVREFECYVKDCWEWTDRFIASSRTYGAVGGARR